MDVFTVLRHASADAIDLDVAGADDRGPVGGLGSTAKRGADPRQQLVDVERLDDVVVGAAVECRQLVGLAAPHGEHDDGHGGERSEATHRLQPVGSRQGQVEEHEIRWPLLGEHDRLLGGAGLDHRVAVRAEARRQRDAERRVVLDHHHGEWIGAGIVVPSRRPLWCVRVHGACGIWGTRSLGLFAVGNYGLPGASGSDVSGGRVEGLFYGGETDQLIAQIKGSATIIVFTLAAGLLVMFTLKALGLLRVSEAGELEGLDIHEHGAPAYHPEPSYEGYSPIPSVMVGAGGGGTQPQAYEQVPVSDQKTE